MSICHSHLKAKPSRHKEGRTNGCRRGVRRRTNSSHPGTGSAMRLLYPGRVYPSLSLLTSGVQDESLKRARWGL